MFQAKPSILTLLTNSLPPGNRQQVFSAKYVPTHPLPRLSPRDKKNLVPTEGYT